MAPAENTPITLAKDAEYGTVYVRAGMPNHPLVRSKDPYHREEGKITFVQVLMDGDFLTLQKDAEVLLLDNSKLLPAPSQPLG